ncbi:MAG: restriction endonuclease [bacterium]|jgi:hypothetical protein|nr:restriction endonuclease [bacterium]
MRKKIKEAIKILKALGAPKNVLSERSALVLLSLAGMKPRGDWRNCGNPRLGIVGNKKGNGYSGIMQFMQTMYKKKYAENTRETIRRNDIHTFIQLGIVEQNVDDPAIPTNSSKNHYSLIPEFVEVLKKFGTPHFDSAIDFFVKTSETRNKRYKKKKLKEQISVELPNGRILKLSPGDHNELQARVIDSFCKYFAKGAIVLYIGDTADKYLHFEAEGLLEIGINISKESHTKLPDVVLYDSDKGWLYLIEAVTSHGPIGDSRIHVLENMLSDIDCGVVYVTAFLSREDFRKYAADIAWETEVWIAEEPTHMIHYNGDKFFGPRKKKM